MASPKEDHDESSGLPQLLRFLETWSLCLGACLAILVGAEARKDEGKIEILITFNPNMYELEDKLIC